MDQIFIGRGVGYLGNGATNVVFPITVISLAIALMLGDGAAAYLSLCQGKKDVKSGNKSMGNVVMLLVAFGVIMAVLFVVYLFLDRKDRKEQELTDKEDKKAERESTTAVLKELSASNRNIAESLNLLKTSMDNTNNEFKQHDERSIKNFQKIHEDLIVLKERK